jgi:hypothetical protein
MNSVGVSLSTSVQFPVNVSYGSGERVVVVKNLKAKASSVSNSFCCANESD